MEKVAAVVVTYNRKKLLSENIGALLKQSYKDCVIIIIDNNSSDGTYELLKPLIDQGKIKYYNTGKNLGGAGGFQYGIKIAAQSGYEYIWVMDDDCIPTETALEVLMDYDKKLMGKYGFLSSKVLWKDMSLCYMNIQRETVTRNLKKLDNKLIQVSMASFVSLFIRTSVVKEVGLPIKAFFIWTDDWEYTRRISRKYPSYVVTDSVVVHKSASNIGANIYSDSYERIARYNYLYRNDVYLYKREGLKGILYEIVRLSSHVVKVLLKANDHKLERIKLIIAGTKNGFKFNPSIEYIEQEK